MHLSCTVDYLRWGPPMKDVVGDEKIYNWAQSVYEISCQSHHPKPLISALKFPGDKMPIFCDFDPVVSPFGLVEDQWDS